jgi:glycosyltransferase involved in cell wall biosynthesis
MENKRVTAVLITFNEENNIERCLASLDPIVDEVVVVDAFSSDRTVNLARTFGKVNVHLHEWQGFSESKNFGNHLATSPFLLSIDADECLSPELQQSILKWKTSASAAQILQVNRLTNYSGKWIRHSGWYPEFKIRIFPKEGSYWVGSLHEELVTPEGLTTGRLDGDLLHYSYPTVDSHLKKIIVYAELAAQKDILAGRKYSLVNHAIIKPAFVFFRKFFLQAGFLDGFYGLVIAVNSSYERFLRYIKYRERIKRK